MPSCSVASFLGEIFTVIEKIESEETDSKWERERGAGGMTHNKGHQLELMCCYAACSQFIWCFVGDCSEAIGEQQLAVLALRDPGLYL